MHATGPRPTGKVPAIRATYLRGLWRRHVSHFANPHRVLFCAQQRHVQQSQVHREEPKLKTGFSPRSLDQLMDPDLFSVFCEEFVAETNRLRTTSQSSRASKEAELAKTNHALERLVQALIDGAPTSTVKGKMAELEERKVQAGE